MLSKFEFKNYKNFREWIIINFSKAGGYKFNEECITNQLISKMIIYGRNATGKTNLGKALLDIKDNFSPRMDYRRQNGVYLNADSKSDYAEYIYTFKFENKELIYKYKKSSEIKLHDEELIINDKKIFYYNFDTKKGNFENLKDLDAATINIDRFTESVDVNHNEEDKATLSFLRWLINNTAISKESVLLKLDNYIRNMFMINLNLQMMPKSRLSNETFYKTLVDEKALTNFEDFLNIMGIKCKLVVKKLPEGEYQLYFKNKKLIPFLENASSGTLVLMDLYRRFEMRKNSSMIYLDEFDAFYHYEMSEKVIEFLKNKYPLCQMILTTHNTNLMNNRLMRPDCLFILSQEGKLTSLCDATTRELREGHNLEKMYISGEFNEYE